MDDFYAWCRDHGHWGMTPADEKRMFKRQFKEALQKEYRIDAKGRRYRAVLPVPDYRDGKQVSLWGDSDQLSHKAFHKNVQDRRRSIVADCTQLELDVQHHNDENPGEAPIQLELDFRDDVQERLIDLMPPD